MVSFNGCLSSLVGVGASSSCGVVVVSASLGKSFTRQREGTSEPGRSSALLWCQGFGQGRALGGEAGWF